MKNIKALPIAIATIILAAFLAISFLAYDASSQVYIAGIKGSYAETYAKDNGVEFIELYDSENPDVEIPKIKEVADAKETDKKEDEKQEEKDVKAEKENGEFAYNYEGETVNIMMYKGYDDIVIIPDTIDNLPVTKLSMRVLNKGILAVYIPQSVTAIDTEFTTARYTAAFYTVIAVMILGYIFAIISTFIGLRKSKTAEDTFYGIPFVYSGLVTYIVISVWCGIALFFGFKPLLQIIVAVIIFACALGKLLKKTVARELIEQRGENVKQQTQFIKMLTADSDALVKNAKSEDAKALAKKVFESIRYSDPMRAPELDSLETDIQERFSEFEQMASKGDIENAKLIADELLGLIETRNNKCKALK